jgi:hypothetical protein
MNITYLLLPHGRILHNLYHLELMLLGYQKMINAFTLLVSFGLEVSMGLLFKFRNVIYKIIMSLELITLILLIIKFVFHHLYFLLFLKIIKLILCLYLSHLCFTGYHFFIILK